MKLTRAGRRLATVIMTAVAVMILCFAERSTKIVAPSPLPYNPPSPLPYNPPAAVTDTARDGRVDINAAGLEELMSLPGIGAVRAQAILDDREANGPFRYPEDLLRVKGIGEGVLGGILDQITTGG